MGGLLPHEWRIRLTHYYPNQAAVKWDAPSNVFRIGGVLPDLLLSCGKMRTNLENDMSDAPQPLLLRTKLHRPRYELDVVLRPQLLARLEEGLRSSLILVSAPAGFGKSTLLSAWLEQCTVPSTWLSLDGEDNDLSTFLTYLIAAVRVLYPAACAETEALGRLATLPSEKLLAQQLINDLDALPAAFVLVLDDYEGIENPAIHEFIAILMRRPPRTLRLVLATRRDPPLPLARLRATGSLTEVRMGDLRLQPQEVAAYWHRLAEVPLDAASIKTLDSIVEGWPAGLRLAAISARLSSDPQRTIASLAGSSAHATDYLFREIFTHISSDRQGWLLRIAVLDRFCAPLCQALCAAGDDPGQADAGSDFIAWLKAVNLFLVPLDDEGLWYRFHYLFLELLRQQLKKRFAPAALSALYAGAADWFAGAGMADDALAYALLIPSVPRALAIVEGQRVAALNQENWPRMRRWLELFSSQSFAEEPTVLMLRANVELNQFRLAELATTLDRLDDLRPYAAEVAVLRSQVCFWQGDVDLCLQLAREGLATLPPDHVHTYGNALIMLALGLQVHGAQDEGLERLLHELSRAASRNAQLTARVLLALTGLHWAAGSLDQVNRYAQRLLDIGERNHLVASRGWAHYFLGCTYYWRNELAQARQHFAAVVEQPLGMHTMVLMHSHFGLVLTYLAQGCLEEAHDVLEAIQAWSVETGDPVAIKQVDAFGARVDLQGGRLAAAFAWANATAETPPRLPMYFLASPLLILARICVTQGTGAQLERAARLLDELQSFLARSHNPLRMIDVLALKALLHKARHQRDQALTTLRQALVLAEPAAALRPFVDLGPEMAELLHQAAKQGPSAAYVAQLLAAFPPANAQAQARSSVPQVQGASLVDALTDRELEVLTLLAQRLSNKEIAEIMVVSPVTVKTHTRNLFSKLQVGGRREAVARGRALGILRPE